MTTLNDNELHVLGVLIEKAFAQAGSYPLTMNALTLGCNQKQNRDPVLSRASGWTEIPISVPSRAREVILTRTSEFARIRAAHPLRTLKTTLRLPSAKDAQKKASQSVNARGVR